MPRPLIAAAAAVAAGLCALPAQAQAPDPSAQDLRCIVVMAAVGARVADADTKQGMAAAVGYFMGRLKGRDPGIDLSARVTAEFKSANLDDLQGDLTRCGDEMKAFAEESRKIGAAVKDIAAAQKPPAD